MISHHPDDPDPRLKRGVVEQLRRQNEVILNAAGEGIYGLDLQGNATFVNPAAIRKTAIADPKSLGLIGMGERVLPWGGDVRIRGGAGQRDRRYRPHSRTVAGA